MAIEPATILEAWVSGTCNDIGVPSATCAAVYRCFDDGFVTEEEKLELEKLGVVGIAGIKPLQYFVERLDAQLKDGKISDSFYAIHKMQFLHRCLERIGKGGDPIDEGFVRGLVERYVALLDIAIKGERLSLREDQMYMLFIDRYVGYISSFGPAGRFAIPFLIRLTKDHDGLFAHPAYETLARAMPFALPGYAAGLLQDPDSAMQAGALWALGVLDCPDLKRIPSDLVKNLADSSANGDIRERAGHVLNLSYFCENHQAEENLPSQRPVACLNGDTPFKTATSCTEEALLKAYKKHWQDFVRRSKAGYYNNHREELYEVYQSPPFLLHTLGTLEATHPFFNIYLYMTPDSGFENIRSARVFEDVTSSKQVRRLVAKQRSLTILYPGSGAHISPVVIPLKLIDEGRIDSAKLIYTEASETDLSRLKLYLDWYNEHGTITGLEIDEESLGAGCLQTRFQLQG